MNNIQKLIIYLSLLKETLKYKNEQNLKSNYSSVDILFPEEFVLIEHWSGDDLSHKIEIPIADIGKRITSAREHLRYLKKRSNGVRLGD